VREWLLINAKWVIFQLYHGNKNLHLNEMNQRWCLLYTRPNHLIGFLIMLAHWNNNLWVEISLYSNFKPTNLCSCSLLMQED
jgi:hypothetical protein